MAHKTINVCSLLDNGDGRVSNRQHRRFRRTTLHETALGYLHQVVWFSDWAEIVPDRVLAALVTSGHRTVLLPFIAPVALLQLTAQIVVVILLGYLGQVSHLAFAFSTLLLQEGARRVQHFLGTQSTLHPLFFPPMPRSLIP